MTAARTGIHWFRRDLRVAGNPALLRILQECDGQVVGLFCLDPASLSLERFSPARFAFLLESLAALREELHAQGGELRIAEGDPEQVFGVLIATLRERSRPLPSIVSLNRRYEPEELLKDEAISRLLSRVGIRVLTERDQLLLEPQELLKDDGTPYQVYTPYAKRWFRRLARPEIQERLPGRPPSPPPSFRLRWHDLLGKTTQGALPWPIEIGEDILRRYLHGCHERISIKLPPAGSAQARVALAHFRSRLERYHELRDFPARDGTSRLSFHLRVGAISPTEVIAELGLGRLRFGRKDGPTVFLQELVWREFYASILFHRPEVETTAFNPKYRALRWENRQDLFDAWKEGQTGYPIVDAGMRQLRRTGWMHNRLRMIVASFLTKDLLIDWRWGERYFMQSLLDGDLASNNGGWQWAASTGADPQPYFRIFNPVLQSRKFDPEGEFIREFVPELRDLDRRKIHLGKGSPIIEHASRKLKALRLYRR